MRYFGGKQRIAKPLCEFINSQLVQGQVFVDAFCGSCNIISNIRNDVIKMANDKNEYLVAMWKALQNGWVPPNNVTEDYYKYIRESQANTEEERATKSFVGFGCSFAGKWWGGYARDGKGRNYAENAFNSTLKKALSTKNVIFTCKDYSALTIPHGSLVYCDIPYKGTTEYSATGWFDHEMFYRWAKEQGSRIIISEYEMNVPAGAKVIWQQESKQDIRSTSSDKKKTVEVLFEFM